jgi:hypothetical protein
MGNLIEMPNPRPHPTSIAPEPAFTEDSSEHEHLETQSCLSAGTLFVNFLSLEESLRMMVTSYLTVVKSRLSQLDSQYYNTMQQPFWKQRLLIPLIFLSSPYLLIKA